MIEISIVFILIRMESQTIKYIVAGDLGGTNVRLYIVKINIENRSSEYVYQRATKTQRTPSLAGCLIEFI